LRICRGLYFPRPERTPNKTGVKAKLTPGSCGSEFKPFPFRRKPYAAPDC
jgi:hypothetical protein